MGVTLPAAAVAGALLLTACQGAVDGAREVATEGAPRAEVVTFTTDDDIELSGFMFGSGATGVVLAHMSGSEKEAWVDLAVSLSNNGYRALTFDFRGYAGQEGRKNSALDLDMDAAITALRAQGASRVFVVGASMGGTAAVDAGARHKLEGIVAVSAPGEFDDIDAFSATGSLDEPALFIVAEDDQPYATETAALAQASGGQLETYEGSAHGTELLTEHGDRFIAQIVRFIQANEQTPQP